MFQHILLIQLLLILFCCNNSIVNRWRTNNYIRDDGILPYQICNAAKFSKSATQLISTTIESFDVLFLASSVWGASADNGEPLSVKSIELMAYIKKSGSAFDACCGGHTFIHSHHVHTLMDRVGAICVLSVDTKLIQSSNGIWNYSAPTTKIPYKELKHPGVVSLHCPVDLIAGTHSFDRFVGSDRLKLSIFLESIYPVNNNASIDVDLCYEHVDKADDLVVITEPIYGFKNHHVFARQFWNGDPPYERHSLLDAYIVYHTKVMGARVYINALHREADELMAKYKNRANVVYRPDWYKVQKTFSRNRHYYPDDASSLILETLAYALGHWENRFRAKYFMILHSADNFAMCQTPNKTITQCLSDIDYNRISAIHVPTCYGVTQNGTLVPSHNVLQRWSQCPGYFGDMRHTPIANPRHTDYVWVHWVSGRRSNFKYDANYSEALSVYHLQTKHIMQLGRNLSKGALASYAAIDQWQSRMGDLLQAELEPFLTTQNMTT